MIFPPKPPCLTPKPGTFSPWRPDVDITTVSAAISAIGRGANRESDGIGTGLWAAGWLDDGWRLGRPWQKIIS